MVPVTFCFSVLDSCVISVSIKLSSEICNLFESNSNGMLGEIAGVEHHQSKSKKGQANPALDFFVCI